MGILTGLLTLYGLGMGGCLAGAKAKSATSSLLHYCPEQIQLENGLQIGDGKLVRVIWAYHDRVKGIFYARLSINAEQYRYVEAKTKDGLEQKVSEVFATL
ncbi:MAG: hypothetical protein J5965_26020 [Aeriscardovia sp.]|nr:hypothetical protein [Aeriscardovia sp.]MBP3756653.1 hypothetical protein [Prevotella sp.]